MIERNKVVKEQKDAKKRMKKIRRKIVSLNAFFVLSIPILLHAAVNYSDEDVFRRVFIITAFVVLLSFVQNSLIEHLEDELDELREWIECCNHFLTQGSEQKIKKHEYVTRVTKEVE